MRRETDFVLEKAAWPALLLEESGTICRANQAARKVFGLTAHTLAAPLASLWGEGNAVPAEKFLAEQAEGGTSELKLSLSGGKKAPFIAHVTRVMRDGENYFVLQLFKESGASFPELAHVPAPTETAHTAKAEVPFGLANADWPALVVDSSGKIVRANATAARAFGPSVEKEGATLGAIWSLENQASAEKFLSAPAHAEPQSLKFRLGDGTSMPFQTQRCSAGQSKLSLIQFFKDSPPVVAAPAPSPPAPAAAPAPSSAEEEFVLSNATWPALLLHRSGKILRANLAALRAFGPHLEKDGQLATIWASDNQDSALQFLSLPVPPEAVPLKFKTKSGLSQIFLGQLCPTALEDICLLQLLKSLRASPDTVAALTKAQAAAAAAPAPTPAPAAGTPAPAGAVATPPVEATLAHKQKLDCALQLARSVSLDFNNALTSILGHTSLLLGKAEPTHAWRSSLVEIEKSASKAAEIANDLAAFSRQEKDVKIQTAGNVNTLIERTMEMFTDKPIAWTKQLERKLFAANFDEAKMQQAFMKIFENAIEAIKQDGRISVQTRNLELSEATQDRTAKLNPGNYVCVEISDNGEGIAPEVLPRIFEPFFTTKGSKHRGLGLAWVYGIVTNHGGGVAVSSQTKVGTAVRLYLPASQKIVKDIAPSASDLTGKQTILIVDDEDLLLTMGQMVLSSFGYTVLTANSGQKALEMFTNAKKPIDLVITDLVMPNMSGRELTDHIHKLSPEMKIIWSSGYVRSANAEEEERYLQKPFTSQDLLRKVKQVLTD